MTYDAYEKHPYLNSPVELYEFNQVNVDIYRYTSSDFDVNIGGFDYTTTPIKRSEIQQNQNLGKALIKVNVKRDLPLVTQYISQPPSNVINLTVRRYHLEDPDEEVRIIWQGRVVNVDFQGEICIIACEPKITAMRRPTLRRLYQTTCPHLLYGNACGVNEVTYRENATISGISGLTVTSSTYGSHSDGYWTGGLVRITKSGIQHSRAIIDHSGNDIELDITIPGLTIGDVLQSLPGCDRRISICVSKYSNEDNMGGFPWIPTKNPMGTNSSLW